jgi:hypothetical protein
VLTFALEVALARGAGEHLVLETSEK